MTIMYICIARYESGKEFTSPVFESLTEAKNWGYRKKNSSGAIQCSIRQTDFTHVLNF
jgi:hypothetical protein